jgi:hypothetical protein
MLMPNSFVKGSAIVRSDNRKVYDRLASSLKEVGIVEEALRNNAEEVLNNLKSFAIRKFRRFDWRPSDDGTSENKFSKRARVDSTQASLNSGNHHPVAEHNPRTLGGQKSPVPSMDSATSLGLSFSYSTHDASSVDHDRVLAVPTREQSTQAVDTSAIGMLCAAASVQDTIPSGINGNTPQLTSTTAINLSNGSRERIHMPSSPWVAYHSSSIVGVDRRPTEASLIVPDSSDVLIPNFQLDIPDFSNVLMSTFNNASLESTSAEYSNALMSDNQRSGIPGSDYSQSNIPDLSNILMSNSNNAPVGSTSANCTQSKIPDFSSILMSNFNTPDFSDILIPSFNNPL